MNFKRLFVCLFREILEESLFKTKKMKIRSIFTILLAVAIIFSCKDIKQNSKEVNAEKTPSLSEEIKINNKGVFINHEMHGDGKFTLLFVHGWCIDQSYWSNQVAAFNSNYKIVTIDLPGFGKSGTNRKDWSVEAYGADINAVIEQLNLKNIIVIGHSMGGNVILEAALENKEILALIGVDNFKDVGLPLNEATKAEIDGFMNLLKTNFSETASAYAESALFHPSTDQLVKNRVVESFKNSKANIAISSLEKLFEYALIESNQLSKLQQKLYLINSDATPTNVKGLEETRIAYEVIDIRATGHYPMIEKPIVFNNLLQQTIQKIIEKEEKK